MYSVAAELEIYLKTPDYTLGLMEGYDPVLDKPVVSFLSGFSFCLEMDHDQWASAVREMPLVYELFMRSNNREFFLRTLGTHIPFQHELGTYSFFNQSLTIFDILEQESIDREAYTRSGEPLTLGITALGLRYR
jgi:hypothetical protein